jgi:Ca2+-binding RTX toxin-like protein
VLNKSLVVDLGANFGPMQGKLYYTHRVDGTVRTDVENYRDINHVTGTAVNDQITGHSGANRLDGSAGDDLIYGDGGADTLIGGAGEDWVMFRPLTRGDTAGPYDAGVVLSLPDGAYRLNGSASDLTAQQFEHALGSRGADALMGSSSSNMLVGDEGDDWLSGEGGADHLFGGTSGAFGNQLLGGSDGDVFWVGYDLNPVTRALQISGTTELLSAPHAWAPVLDATGVEQVINTSIVRDWDRVQDALRVSTAGVAVIGGLAGQSDWTGPDTVDLRTRVDNQGLIKVALGAGTNELYASTGADQIWVTNRLLALVSRRAVR